MFLAQCVTKLQEPRAAKASTGRGLGYLVSIVSVFFLGSIAWPQPNEPWWHVPALILGMATSITGMAFRYKSHFDQQRELSKTKAEARSR